ncbi:MAG TPA: FdhF/YdeP family oxidoreductase, partial [Roseiflexaceae bacterium]|nr:FdhF/YdeP family oxidoreductase [Roseiflexaceae bacterium]
KHGWDPRLWVSLKPFGVGEQHPNNFKEIALAIKENSDNLPYAWRILNQGVCDGCALGTTGMRDWTIDGIHLCNIRLRLLRLNTMPAFDPAILADVAPLQGKRTSELRELGRLPYPMLRHAGEAGFRRVGWDEALDLMADRICTTAPERTAYYFTSRGIPNETYYAAQKAVRAMGSNNIDNAARLCHSPSTVSLKDTVGVGATSCSYTDWFESELIVFFGSNIATNQPVATKYLYYARKNGAQVAVVNPYREEGMANYWIPSNVDSALFGTRLTDRFFQVDIGGDVAFINGALKHMLAEGWIDATFIREHTTGFEAMAAALARQSWEELERSAGVSRDEMFAFAQMVGRARRAVFVWSMGITQHENGEDAVRAIVNLALSGGFVGRAGCGLMPIRGHSGVQGGAEMGAYASVMPGGAPITPEEAQRWSALWRFPVPATQGLKTVDVLEAAHAGELDVLVSVGGNFLEVLPDPDYTAEALGRVPLRVHFDIILTPQMLIEPADTVLLLPAMTRYEIPGGVTETSTERRVMFSPEIEGPRIGEARAEGEVLLDLARRVRPEYAAQLQFEGMPAIRAEIARTIPRYDGIQHLKAAGDQFQYGGAHLYAGGQFETPDRRARFSAVQLDTRKDELPPGMFRLKTRRGKQFNSIVHEQVDPINGARRDDVLISRADAEQLGLRDGEAVLLRSTAGEMAARVRISQIKPGNLQVHWPEGNVLIDHGCRSPRSGIPDYNALVSVEKRQDATGSA